MNKSEEINDEEERVKFQALDIEYQEYIHKLKFEWKRENPFHSDKVIEIWDTHDKERADSYAADWAYYVKPFAEAWWKERGYGIIWPNDNSKSSQIYKLESVPENTANGN